MTDATLTWTEERVERLKTLWQEGKSASFVAAELGGVSRNAVIGKVHRLGLSGRGKTQDKGAPARQRPLRAGTPESLAAAPMRTVTDGATALAAAPREAPRAQVRPQPQTVPRPAPQPVARPATTIAAPVSERVTIMELRESMCRWPIGDPSSPDFRFCGACSPMGVPYCTEHAQIAYQPSADRRRDRRTGTG